MPSWSNHRIVSREGQLSEDMMSPNNRRIIPSYQIKSESNQRVASKTDDSAIKISLNIPESRQQHLPDTILHLSNPQTRRIDDSNRNLFNGMSFKDKHQFLTGKMQHTSIPPSYPRNDDLKESQLFAESRQRPSSGQIPTWSNPPNVPWVDDPSSGDSTSLLPILYLLAPLVITAMLMPIGATLITAIVMMKAHHAGQGRFNSLLFREDNIAPMFKVFEQNLLEFRQKLVEAIAKYDDINVNPHRKF
ncbi:uncharacterized protein CEXT_741461 [Caerostris extrusa]|uniref:Uncharacterized protein n=1 Tax=Caerostris extrusa TaxID=172846 RepID=A0AAV4UCE0_CAEEX|nr:uncharacterized protein CEXT_741461 [Caerostris extrusa]